jgi:hypothetical protein
MLQPCRHEKLARGAQDKEHAMSQKLSALTVKTQVGGVRFNPNFGKSRRAAQTVAMGQLRSFQ